MAKSARIPITNIYADGAYTGRICVGARRQPLNVLFDTGSSVLALDGRKYAVDPANGDKTTRLAQYGSYSDGSHWVGGVIKTEVTVGDLRRTGADGPIVAKRINVAVAHEATPDMFEKADGILGLAYSPLDEAWEMGRDTIAHKYKAARVREGRYTTIMPYLTMLERQGVVSDVIAFVTHRSFIHRDGGRVADDPLNQGWMILGAGPECREFYEGRFQTAKVLAEQWYNTNLKAFVVGDSEPVAVHQKAIQGYPSNSIVDSGTNSLDIGPLLLKALIGKFKPAQQALLNAAIFEKKPIPMAALKLANWPDLDVILQGESRDIRLTVRPKDYWQVNAPKAGLAHTAFSIGDPGFTILGLPLMNGYYTVFDGEADNGRGQVRFATLKR
jgi:hypothetical protein